MLPDSTKSKHMDSRRHFIRKTFVFVAGIGLFFAPIFTLIRKAWSQAKRIILPKGTKMSGLINQNPATLDTRNLEVTPLSDFETMGLADHEVNLDTWQ